MVNPCFPGRLCRVAALTVFVAFGRLRGEDASRNHFWVPKDPPKAHYKIDCSIDPAKGLLEGKEIIRFRNSTGAPIHRFAIKWFSYEEVPLEIKSSMQFTVNGRTVLPLTGKAAGPVVFELPDVLKPRKKVNLQIEFAVSAPAYAGQDKLILTDWHPRLWWGFETHDDFDVKIEVPSNYVLAAGGMLSRKTGRYRAKGVRSFGLFLGKDFDVIEANAHDVLVRCIFPPKGRECAELLLRTAVDVIGFYRQRFGFYPYPNLTIVPGHDEPKGGWPIATGIVGIHGMQTMSRQNLNWYMDTHWRWITAHEIGHQYWGEYVLEKDKPGWLWIALGIYADREYVRARGLSTVKHLGLMDRYIEGARKGLDTTMNRSQEEMTRIKFDFNNVVTHGKGYAVISALHCVLGKEVFGRICRRCLKEFAGQRLGVADFQRICERESGQDLGWFFEQWVNSDKQLVYEISSQECQKRTDGYLCKVGVKRVGNLKMPLPVAAYFEDGTVQRRFTDRLLDVDTLTFKAAAPLKRAFLDPENRLALVDEVSGEICALPKVGSGDRALVLFKRASRTGFSRAGSWFILGLLLYDGKYYEEALQAFQWAYELGDGRSSRKLASLVWQGHILDLQGRRGQAVACYGRALSEGKDFEVRHGQYEMRINRRWVEERLEQPFVRK
ncbi:MAG TPA: M1 family aminopeptidase [Sedimentisphaerales bacterium]|nr:M1 family aminopeptidase [Sedimentisphaerales bacterium]